MQKIKVNIENLRLHLNKSFIRRGTSGRGCRQPQLLSKLFLTLSLSSTSKVVWLCLESSSLLPFYQWWLQLAPNTSIYSTIE